MVAAYRLSFLRSGRTTKSIPWSFSSHPPILRIVLKDFEIRNLNFKQGKSWVAITASDQPTVAQVVLGYLDGEQQFQTARSEISDFDSLRYVYVQLPATSSTQLKVWAHRLSPAGDSDNLPTVATIRYGSREKTFDPKLSDGQIELPANEPCRVEIQLNEWEVEKVNLLSETEIQSKKG